MAVNKTVAAGAAAVVVVGAGALMINEYYLPQQTAAAWAAGNVERAATLADYAFSFAQYTALFALMMFGGLALLAATLGGPGAGPAIGRAA